MIFQDARMDSMIQREKMHIYDCLRPSHVLTLAAVKSNQSKGFQWKQRAHKKVKIGVSV